MTEGECSEVFSRWNKGVLDSFLIEITADILKYNDTDGKPLVTKILDSAGQKVPIPIPLITRNSISRFVPIRLVFENCTDVARAPANGLPSTPSISDNPSLSSAKPSSPVVSPPSKPKESVHPKSLRDPTLISKATKRLSSINSSRSGTPA